MQTNHHFDVGMPSIHEEPFSLRDFLSLIFKHNKKIIILFILCTVGSVGLVYFQDVFYESRSKILINVRAESLSPDPSISAPLMGAGQNISQLLAVELAILDSDELLEQVIEKIGVDAIVPDTDQEQSIISELKKRVKSILAYAGYSPETSTEYLEEEKKLLAKNILRYFLKVTGRENIITLSYEATDPYTAQVILEQIVTGYMDKHIELLEPYVTTTFLEQQYRGAVDLLAQKEQELKSIKKQHKITSLADQKAMLITQVGELKSRILQSNEDLNATKAKIAYLTSYLQGIEKNAVDEPLAISSPAMVFLRQRLVEYKLKRAELANKYPEDSRYLQDIDEQIKITEQSMVEEKKIVTDTLTHQQVDGANTIIQTPESLLESERSKEKENAARLAFLNQQIVILEKELAHYNEFETVLKKLEREIIELEEESKQFQSYYQKSLVTAALEKEKISNLRIIQAPTFTSEPVQTLKERYRIVVLGMVAGLMGGVAISFLIEYFSQTIKSNKDVEKRLGLPVIATVPYKEMI